MERSLIKLALVSALFCQSMDLNKSLARNDNASHCKNISKDTLREAVKKECPGKKFDGVHFGWPARCVATVAEKLRKKCREESENGRREYRRKVEQH